MMREIWRDGMFSMMGVAALRINKIRKNAGRQFSIQAPAEPLT